MGPAPPCRTRPRLSELVPSLAAPHSGPQRAAAPTEQLVVALLRRPWQFVPRARKSNQSTRRLRRPPRFASRNGGDPRRLESRTRSIGVCRLTDPLERVHRVLLRNEVCRQFHQLFCLTSQRAPFSSRFSSRGIRALRRKVPPCGGACLQRRGRRRPTRGI